MTSSSIEWLQRWYLQRCDGTWEKSHGVKIGTIGNPGWSLIVDLVNSKAGVRELPHIQDNRSEHDWVAFEIREAQFRGWCGPTNLEELIGKFRMLVEDTVIE